MRIVIEQVEALKETEIVVRCAGMDEQLIKLLATLRAYEMKITGMLEGRTYLLSPGDILYADTVDKRVFLYTRAQVYETPLRLYELEERLSGRDFFRASKSVLINFAHVESLRPDFGGRIEVRLTGGERLTVSRQYAPEIKKRLGV